jgi:hypothetical protein
MWTSFFKWLAVVRDRFARGRKVFVQVGDALPANMPKEDLILLKDDGEEWSVGFYCPCGCGDVIELLLLPDVAPRWDIRIDPRGRPSLTPSVWRTTGCRSHFWLRDGHVIWVNTPSTYYRQETPSR